jgi:hypothetical protein
MKIKFLFQNTIYFVLNSFSYELYKITKIHRVIIEVVAFLGEVITVWAVVALFGDLIGEFCLVIKALNSFITSILKCFS